MKSWLPTVSIAIAAFIFVTSEFIPVGLLSEIARGFHRTEGQTGLMMTIYAWIVAGLSIPLTAYVSKINRRPLMLWLVGLFVFAHLLSFFALSFEMLVVSRAMVAVAHAVYWAIAIPLGIRLAPASRRDHAMSIVATGATLGGLLGIPFGTYLGQLFGWRWAFGAIGLCAALIGFVLFAVLPSAESRNSGSFESIGVLFRRKSLLIVYLITAITMTGEYTMFTFISPFLQGVASLAPPLIATVLLVHGCAGLISSFIAPKFVSRRLRASAFVSVTVVCTCLFVFRFVALTYFGTLCLVFIWGSAFLFFNLILQNLVLAIAPDAEDVAMAGYSGIYNIGIGGGALFGSLSSAAHISWIGFIGGSFMCVSLLMCVYLLRPAFVAALKIDAKSVH